MVVLSHPVWQELFGGQDDAVGKSLLLDGKSYRVVGVMRSDFDWPRNEQLWIPLGLDSSSPLVNALRDLGNPCSHD